MTCSRCGRTGTRMISYEVDGGHCYRFCMEIESCNKAKHEMLFVLEMHANTDALPSMDRALDQLHQRQTEGI